MNLRRTVSFGTTLFGLVAVVLPTVGCSKGQEAKRASILVSDDEEEESSDGDMEMMQEFGGMNESKVTSAFKRLVPDLSNCLTTASDSHRFISGDVAFLVKVNLEGAAEQAHIEHSNLGSHEAEQCMSRVLLGSRWPKPVGGYIGLARWSIGFDAPSDERPPGQWSSNDVVDTLAKSSNSEALDGCGSGGPFEITAYIEPDGSVSSAGVAHADDNGAETASCLVRAVEEMTFDSPGSWRAKVTFTR